MDATNQLTRSRIMAVIFALPGVVGLFLPFDCCTSPLEGLFKYNFGVRLIAAPAFLAIPILLWQMRRLFVQRLFRFEIAAAYVLAASTMISVITFIVLDLIRESVPEGLDFWVATGTCILLVFANLILLRRNMINGTSREKTAEVFMLGSYMPNMVFCLIVFGWFGNLGIGAYTLIIACIGYASSIFLALSEEKPRSL